MPGNNTLLTARAVVAHARIFREFSRVVTSQVGAGDSGEVATAFTADHPLLIRGWHFSCEGSLIGGAFLNANMSAEVEVTRVPTARTNYSLDVVNMGTTEILDVAGAENVAGVASQTHIMERFLTRDEAIELGLVLGYGESIYIVQQVGVGVGGTGTIKHTGFWLYEEIHD